MKRIAIILSVLCIALSGRAQTDTLTAPNCRHFEFKIDLGISAGITLYNSGNKFTALRIGWLMLGVGCGFLFGFLINMMATYGQYASNFDNVWRYHSVVGGIVYVACICICGGIGLLLSYRAERKAEHPEEKKADEF